MPHSTSLAPGISPSKAAMKRKESTGLFFGPVQFATENDAKWEGYRVVLTYPEPYKAIGGAVGISIVVVKEE